MFWWFVEEKFRILALDPSMWTLKLGKVHYDKAQGFRLSMENADLERTQ